MSSSSASRNISNHYDVDQYHQDQFQRFKEQSENDKKLRRRRQNNESSRRSRERKRTELEMLQKSQAADKARIQELEALVAHLSNELSKYKSAADVQTQNPSTSSTRQPQQSFTTNRNAQSEKQIDWKQRPDWFGSAF